MMSTKVKFVLPAVVVALIAAALLVVPPWLTGAGGTTMTASTAAYTVRLSTDGPREGPNTFDLDVTTRDGAPADLDDVTLQPVMPQMGHAYPPVTAVRTGPGRYRAKDTVLAMTGYWQINVTLRGANDVQHAAFTLLVS
ncbi:FixH family protein [Nonomuraea mesophila]|nr:FixH family protein [Nonomuraea mesophila]